MDNYPGDEVFDRIEDLCDAGEELMDEGKYDQALKKFWKAFTILPEPKTQYPSGTWLLVSIGDIYFIFKDYKNGIKNLTEAKKFPEGEGNPYLHLRLGQCHFEEGNIEEARKEMKIAYEIDGKAIFEDEDEKYLQLIIEN